jgi:signal transduction histidine kinase
VAYDKSKNYIATPRTQLLGKTFFANDVQEFFHHNQIQNNLYHQVFSGKPGYAVYDFVSGERLNIGYPIFLSGKPTYFVFVITPTATIYSHVDEVLFTQRIETFSLLAGITIAVAVLIIFLIKWNSILDYEVKRRTEQLEDSNRQLSLSNQQLALANEQLKVHDKMQKEFINIASHEMKTPTQAIIGYSELLQNHPDKKDEIMQAISRNAIRLQRLTSDILDVTRIESQSLKLNLEQFNLKDAISSNVQVYNNQIEKQGKKEDIKLVYDGPKDISIKADKARVYQVISNLLNNAVKFTQEGIIYITVEKKADNEVVVKVQDTGQGIDPTILPRLYSKFASKSFEGTGLGLYISKNIVEAHGGRMWAENNRDGKGATFSFSLLISN